MRQAVSDQVDGSATAGGGAVGRAAAAGNGIVPGQRGADVDTQVVGPDGRSAVPIGLARLRLLLALGMGTVLVSYASLVPIGALVVLGAGGELTFDGAFALGAPLWLAAHQVPLLLDGVPLSVLPLLPTIWVGVLVMVGCSAVARCLGGRNPTDAGPVVATVAGAHGTVAVLLGAALPPGNAVAAAPWAALLGGALTAGAAGTIGVVQACGPPPRWQRAPGWLRIGARAGAAGLAGLAAASAVLVLAALVSSASQVLDSIAAAGEAAGAAGAAGLTALSAGYLPNAVGAAASWLLGPGFSVGGASASVFGVVAGPLPNVPLLAAMPVGPPPGWAAIVFVLPVLAGAAVGRLCRLAGELVDRLRAVAAAALVITAGIAVLAAVSGGRLAGGPFDPVQVPAWAAAAAALGWTALPAIAATLGARRIRPARRPASSAARRGADRSQ